MASSTANTTTDPISTTGTGNARFNADAANWDSNPSIQLATSLAFESYLSRLPPPSELSSFNVLEIGCGTGLLSLLLAPHVRSLAAVDAAEGMIDVLTHKLSPGGTYEQVKNVRPVTALLEEPEDPIIKIDPVTGEAWEGKFNLVISHLVLHHVADLTALFKTIYGTLKPGTGRVVTTDFENFGPEARRFHPEAKMDGVERHGITKEEMEEILKGVGFEEVKVERGFVLQKRVESEPGKGDMERGPVMEFPFLVCEGRRV
ncbi:S-adenosyl-L-methionine-dependent methyltransferase [Neurospora hispaniola]|uniref:S-adenosyl-L-methionine-dependent methyltransferase n=1 Tax=Neurospora hispaniola TaxID=588809 RepID=A0AAJ0I196_9PEZI|nr:S-adenosyl-L-methionine-dependent methyltransferase [Neurospora hispaniola]